MKTKDLSDLRALSKALHKSEEQQKAISQKKKDTPKVLPDGSNATLEDYLAAGEPSLEQKFSEEPPSRRKQKASRDYDMVVDLHASVIQIPSSVPKSSYLAYQIEYFNRIMEDSIPHKGKRILFVHGIGEGTLRSALISELDQRWWTCRYQTAGQGGYGMESALLVTIR